MVLLIDNYDSFANNLARYIRELGFEVVVKRNDAITINEIMLLQPSHIVLSPGPCTPNEAGICLDVIDKFKAICPILGVCLGHQAIGQYFGGKVIRANKPMHGKRSVIYNVQDGVFKGLEQQFMVGRYHSLVVSKDNFPAELIIGATTEDGTIMALWHKILPIVGVQFHPESILTQHGSRLLANFFSVKL